MKKHISIVFAMALALSLFTGCRKRMEPVPTTMPTTVPTRPAATAAPTEAMTQPSTRATVSPVTTDPTYREDSVESTIEDGNGPIPSQNPSARRK